MLTKWETFFLMMMTIPIMGHVVMLPLILDVAGRDAWISAIISLPFALGFGFSVFRFRQRYPEQDFSKTAAKLLGKPVSRILMFFLACYFLYLSILSIARLADMVNIAFLPETPIWVLVSWFVPFCLYSVSKGIKITAWTAGLLAFLAIGIGYFVSFASFHMKDWSSLMPFLEFGWTPPIWGTVVFLSIWTELLFLMLIPLQNPRERSLYRVWCLGIVWNGLIMLAQTTGVLMIFGLGQVGNFTYPALETVRIISLGFIDRLDLYGMALMAFGCYIRASLYLALCQDLIVPKSLSSARLRKTLLFGFGGVALALSIYVASDHIRLQKFTAYYIFGTFLLPLPFLLLFISWFRNLRSQTKGQVLT